MPSGASVSRSACWRRPTLLIGVLPKSWPMSGRRRAPIAAAVAGGSRTVSDAHRYSATHGDPPIARPRPDPAGARPDRHPVTGRRRPADRPDRGRLVSHETVDCGCATLDCWVGIRDVRAALAGGVTPPQPDTAFGGFPVLDGFALSSRRCSAVGDLVILSVTTFADREELVKPSSTSWCYFQHRWG